MPVKRKDKKKAKNKKPIINVTDTVGNYEKHPFFVKKAAAAKNLLAKVGLPKEMSKKSVS